MLSDFAPVAGPLGDRPRGTWASVDRVSRVAARSSRWRAWRWCRGGVCGPADGRRRLRV